MVYLEDHYGSSLRRSRSLEYRDRNRRRDDRDRDDRRYDDRDDRRYDDRDDRRRDDRWDRADSDHDRYFDRHDRDPDRGRRGPSDRREEKVNVIIREVPPKKGLPRDLPPPEVYGGGYGPPPLGPPPIVTQPKGPATLDQLFLAQNTRSWTSPLFGCGEDFYSCIIGTCCPCVLSVLVATRLRESGLVCCFPGSTMAMRTRMRTLFGITGSMAEDGVAGTFCGPCALCQMYRHAQYTQL